MITPLRRFRVRLALLMLTAASALPIATQAASADFANSPKVTLRVTSASPAGMEDSKALVDTA